MPRKHTASFILELPLKTDPGDERACAIILDAGRNIGNAVLGEGLRRLDLMRESRADRAARKMSRGEPRSPSAKPERTNSSGCSRAQRYHQFPDGTRVGRDLYSAFLARFEDSPGLN
jgi:putative transposase